MKTLPKKFGVAKRRMAGDMKKFIASVLVFLAALSLLGSQFDYVGSSLGIAVYDNPTSEKTLASAPTSGIVLPLNSDGTSRARSAQISIETAPMRFYFGSTATTSTSGLLMQVGLHYIDNKPDLLKTFRFQTDSSGASKMTIEYYGTGR